MEKETLEEVAERYKSLKLPDDLYDGFIEGANWQAKRMYYEEEVVDLIADWTKMAKGLNMNFPSDKFEEWFKQFERE